MMLYLKYWMQERYVLKRKEKERRREGKEKKGEGEGEERVANLLLTLKNKKGPISKWFINLPPISTFGSNG